MSDTSAVIHEWLYLPAPIRKCATSALAHTISRAANTFNERKENIVEYLCTTKATPTVSDIQRTVCSSEISDFRTRYAWQQHKACHITKYAKACKPHRSSYSTCSSAKWQSGHQSFLSLQMQLDSSSDISSFVLVNTSKGHNRMFPPSVVTIHVTTTQSQNVYKFRMDTNITIRHVWIQYTVCTCVVHAHTQQSYIHTCISCRSTCLCKKLITRIHMSLLRL